MLDKAACPLLAEAVQVCDVVKITDSVIAKVAKKMDQDKVKQRQDNRGKTLQQGAAAAWPVCLGYLPLGLAMGVLAQQAGIPAWLTGLMSIFLFAGSAQFIGVAMIDAGASMAAIVTTTFVVNLRHALMGSALAVHLRGVQQEIERGAGGSETDRTDRDERNRTDKGG